MGMNEMFFKAEELDYPEEQEIVCQNCGCFFQNDADDKTGIGICSLMPEFDEFMDTIIEENTFEHCLDLYQSKCFDGSTNSCEKFSAIEVIDENELEYYRDVENLQRADPSGVHDQLINSSIEEQIRIVNYLDIYVRSGNERVFTLMLEYFKSLPIVDTLQQVNHRLVVIKVVSAYPDYSQWVLALVDELTRTPSNQTTRRLFVETLKILKSKNEDVLIGKSLATLLEKRNFAPKMRMNIIDAMHKRIPEFRDWFHEE